MDYETFKQYFEADIREKLEEKGYENVKINFDTIEKTNQKYEAMSVVPEGSNVGVNFNIENSYAIFDDTDDYAGVLASATMLITEGLKNVPAFDLNTLLNYEKMKDKLSVEVISADTNKKLLENVPHDKIEDLAVVYRFVLESDRNERSSILITNAMINQMGVTPEQLREDALVNSPEIRPVIIKGMNDIMREMMGSEAYEMMGMPEDVNEKMYVATVVDMNSGAGVLAYQNFMDQAAEKLGGDFFVLPSSIHEILLIPDNGEMVVEELKSMVHEVNLTQVKPEERLTDSVYHYDSKNHIFELAEKFEERQQEREKGSLLKNLKDKQKESAAKPQVKDSAEKAIKSKERESL